MAESNDKKPSWRDHFTAWWEGVEVSDIMRRRYPRPNLEQRSQTIDTSPEPEIFHTPPAPVPEPVTIKAKPLWSATRIQVIQKLWGPGTSSPGNRQYLVELVKPLGLHKELQLVDLALGMGAATRVMSETYHIQVTGFEASTLLAKEAASWMQKAGLARRAEVKPCLPHDLPLQRQYDVAFAKEGFFTVNNKGDYFDKIEQIIKPGGQLYFTDYVAADDEARSALAEWCAVEPLPPHLMTVKELKEALRGLNLDVRVMDDASGLHMQIINSALEDFAGFLDEVRVDWPTFDAAKAEVELWGGRVAAMKSGLKLLRVHALKPKT